MKSDNETEKNIELQERIKAIKNICYFAYNKEVITCTAVFAFMIILVMSIVLKQFAVVLVVDIIVILLSIIIIFLYLCFNKKSIHVNFKVIKYEIDCKDIIPQSILNLLDNYNID